MNVTINTPRQPVVTIVTRGASVVVAPPVATRTVTTNIGVVGPKGDKGDTGEQGGLAPDAVVDCGYF